MPYKFITAIALCSLTLYLCACNPWSNKSSEPTVYPTAEPGKLQVHFIDVGQGDAILIDLGTTEVLIDAGEKSPGVTDYLENYVDDDLELMVATHPHTDHIGGLIEVLDEFKVDNIWVNGDVSTSKTYIDFMAEANDEEGQIHVARRGDKLVAGTLTFYVLNPPSTLFSDTNDNSIVLQLNYGNIDFLFTGDAEIAAEQSMIDAGVLSDIDILKVGHHGSRSASSSAFLAVTHPEVAIYMAGTGNDYGHPHQETLTALADIGATIYGTDKNGTIVLSTDGTSYTIRTDK